MKRWIVRNSDGVYQYNRLSTGRMYEYQTDWGTDRNQARIFTTKGAATTSMNDASRIKGYPRGMKIVEVELTWKEIDGLVEE